MAAIVNSSIEKTLSPSDVEKATFSTKGADVALEFLRIQRENGEIVEIDEKKLVRKIDFMIVPYVSYHLTCKSIL
jgi:hypothetical protein